MKNPLYHIFKKELLETVRDKRTLMAMVVVPVLVFPLVFVLISGITKSFNREALEKELKIGILQQEANNPVVQFIENAPLGKISFTQYEDSSKFNDHIRNDSIHAALFFEDDFRVKFEGEETAQMKILLNSTDMYMKERITVVFNQYSELWKTERLNKLNISPEKVQPLQITFADVASDKEIVGKLAGGILPYLFIVFCFIGCMYPAIDLFTGEKERGTIETILSTPIKRWQLLFGKMSVVVLSGLLAATLALLGLYFSFEFLNVIEDEGLKKIIHDILSFRFLMLMYCLLIPLTIFFGGIMIPIAINAKTYKEAQSIITPLNILVVLPAMLGFLPGVEYNLTTAFIPIVNIVLAIKEVIAGTIDPLLLFFSFSTLVLMALIVVFISHRQYGKETNIIM